MKEEIYKILNKTLHYMDHDRVRTAAEIEGHVMEFSRWVANEISVDWDTMFYSYYPYIGGEMYFKTFEELYPYWKTNINT
jgi:hypothetical protein